MDKLEWFSRSTCKCCIHTISPDVYLVADLVMESLDRTKYKYIHNFDFPYWSKNPEGKLSNLYVSYKPPKHHWWKRLMLHFGWTDDMVAVHIKDQQLYVLSQINAGAAYRTDAFSLADPDCFSKIGKHIVKAIA